MKKNHPAAAFTFRTRAVDVYNLMCMVMENKYYSYYYKPLVCLILSVAVNLDIHITFPAAM